jgi:hypothetical protein
VGLVPAAHLHILFDSLLAALIISSVSPRKSSINLIIFYAMPHNTKQQDSGYHMQILLLLAPLLLFASFPRLCHGQINWGGTFEGIRSDTVKKECKLPDGTPICCSATRGINIIWYKA